MSSTFDAQIQGDQSDVGQHDPQVLDTGVDSSLELDKVEQSAETTPTTTDFKPKPELRRIVGLSLVILGVLAVGLISLFKMLGPKISTQDLGQNYQPSQVYKVQSLPLNELSNQLLNDRQTTGSLGVNGLLKVYNSITLEPIASPANAVQGQIYFDKNKNQLAYFNGSKFVYLQTPKNFHTTSIGGLTGAVGLANGLSVIGNSLTNSGVLSLGGHIGTLQIGTGLGFSGNSIRNNGVVSLASGTPTLQISNDGNGNLKITNTGGGSGNVSTSGGTSGKIVLFNGATSIGDSIMSQSGSTVSVAGTLSATTLQGSGSGITNLNASNISSGTVANARLSASVTLQGNTFNGASELLQLNGTAGLPALNGSLLTSLNASNISSGTLANARLSASVTLQGNTFNVANALLQLNGTGGIPALNGSLIASLNGSNISSGTVADARLSSNITLLNGNNNFTGATLQHNGNNICDTSGNCAGSGSGVTTSGGTMRTIAMFTGAQSIGDSILSQNIAGDAITVGGTLSATDLQGDGSGITNMSASNISSGTLNDLRLSSNVTLQGNTFNGNNQLLQLNGTAGIPALDGSLITNLDASHIASGTLNDLRLSANAALYNRATSNFTGALQQGGNNVCTTAGNCAGAGNGGGISNSGTQNYLTKTDASGNLVDSQIFDNGTNVGVGTNLPGYNLDVNGSANATTLYQNGNQVCDTTGNCAGVGGGITGSGTTRTISMFTAAGAIGDSIIAQNAAGNTITVGGTLSATNLQGDGSGIANLDAGSIATGTLSDSRLSSNVALLNVNNTFTGTNDINTNSTTAFNVEQNGVHDNVFTVDTTNGTVGINQAPQSAIAFTVNGTTQSTNIIVSSGTNSNNISKNYIVGTGGVTANDVVVLANDGGNSAILDTTTASDNRVMGVAGATKSTGQISSVVIAGNTTVSADTAAVAIGDQLVTSSTSGKVTVDNNATTGILGYATSIKAGGSNGSVGVYVKPFNGVINPTYNGNVTIQGGSGLTLSTALTVPNGGTGAVTLGANGVLLGNGTSPISSLVAGSPNLCLESTAGAPIWAACTGGGAGGVTSLDSQSGVLTLANSSGSSGTITIDNAMADGSTKGIAAFNATNFSASSGVINTIQDIATTSSPTFTAVNTNTVTPSGAFTLGSTTQAFTLQGSSASVLSATGGGFTTTLGFSGSPAGAVNYNFDRGATAGTYTVCTTSGNCVGGGGSAIGGSGSTNQIAKFTAAGTIGNSSISDTGSSVTITPSSNSTTAFQLQNASGASLFNIDTSTTVNLLPENASNFETGQAWTTLGSGVTLTQDTAGVVAYSGTHTLKIVTTAAGPTGAQYPESFTSGTNYSFSVYARLASGSMSTFTLGYHDTSDHDCIASGLSTTGWNRIICGFVASATASGYLYIKDTGNGNTFYIDAAQFETSGQNASPYNGGGQIQLNGVISSSLSIKNAVNSNTALLLSNAAGSHYALQVDTNNNRVGIDIGANGGPGTDLAFGSGSDRTISVNTSQSASGRNLTILPGASSGGSTFTGGSLFLQGAGTNGSGAGGSITLTPGTSTGGGSPGSVIVKPASSGDSTTAFQVQNATGGSMLNVSTSGSAITLLSGAGGDTGAWASATNTVTSARQYAGSVIYNGFMYVVGGADGTNDNGLSTVYYSRLNADGTPGTWTTATNSPSARMKGSVVVANGYLYILGGVDGVGPPGNASNKVQYARINSDGSLGTWATDSTTIFGGTTRDGHTSVFLNGYVYVLNGQGVYQPPNAPGGTMYVSRLNADGSSGTWVQTTSLGVNRIYATSVAVNGYIYVIGGASDNTPTDTNTVYYGKQNSDGTVSSWTTTSALPASIDSAAAGVANGYMYVMGGKSSGTAQTAVYYAKINSDGTVGAWSTSSQSLPGGRYGLTSLVANGNIYAITGNNGSGAQSQVYYASLPKVQIDGDLDLVGLQGVGFADGGSLSQGETGGSITAGNVRAIGGLNVSGPAVLNNGLSVQGATALSGSSTGSLGMVLSVNQPSNASSASTSPIVSFSNSDADSGAPVLDLTQGDASATTLQLNANLGAGTAIRVSGNGNNTPGGSVSFASGSAAFSGAYVQVNPTRHMTSGTGTYTESGNFLQLARSDFNDTAGAGVYAITGDLASLSSNCTQNTSSCTDSSSILSLNQQYANATGAVLKAQGSGTGNLLQLQTGTPTTVMSVSSTGTALFENSTNSTTAFQVQNATGSQLLSIDTSTTPNLLINPSFENSTTGWACDGSCSPFAQSTAQKLYGNDSLRITTGAAANSGAKQNITLTDSTTYTLYFSIRRDSGDPGFSSMTIGYSADGSTHTTCATGLTATVNYWNYYACTFTTPSSHSGTPFIFLDQSSATTHSWYLDGIQLTQSGSTAPFQEGQIALNGVVNSPVSFRNQSDSSYAFQIQNAAGNSGLFIADTADSRIGIGGTPGNIASMLSVTNSAGLTQAAAIINQANTSFDALDVQSNGANVFSLSGTGATVFKNTSNSTAAFQLQNAGGADIINVDSTSGSADLVSNGSFELTVNGAAPSGWSSEGSATLTASNTTAVYGFNSLSAALGGSPTGNDGGKYPITLSDSTTYSLSFFVVSASSLSNSFSFGYSADGSTENTANITSLGNSVGALATSGWSRFTLNFTTPGSHSGTPYLFFKETDSMASNTFYIDGIDLEQSSGTATYKEGGLQLNGNVTSPLAIETPANNSNAFSVLDHTGTSVFKVDTKNLRVGINTTTATADLSFGANGGSGRTINVNNAVSGNNGDGLTVQSGGGNGSNKNGGGITLQGGNATGAGTGGNITLQPGTTSSGTAGAVIVKPGTDSANAFQIQNSGATATLLTADTSGMVITISGTTSTFATLAITNAHFKSTQTNAPTIGTPANCGTSPSSSVTANSTDSAGSFTITNGNPSGTTCDTQINFNKAYGAAPKSIIVVPKGSATAATRQVYVSSSASGSFTVTYSNNVTAAGEADSFYYWIVE